MSQGKRAGARHKPQVRPTLLLLALGVTAAVVAWGYLVSAAIDFGSSARAGDSGAWWFLLLAALGAVMCLFLALMLLVRIVRAPGIRRPPTPTAPATPPPYPSPPAPSGPPAPPSEPGGRRAAR